MLLNGNAIAVIFDVNDQRPCLLFYTHSDMLDGIRGGNRTHTRISSIYNQFIEKLVKSRVKCDLAMYHLSIGAENPSPLLMRFHRPYVGIRELEDVLAVGELLVRDGLYRRHVGLGKGGVLPINF